MKGVTNLMIYNFKLKEVGCDFMGYRVQKEELKQNSSAPIQFHHLKIARKDCLELPDKGYNEQNGALLINDSHEYLHRIANYEREMFDEITKIMIRENEQGYLDKQSLLEIKKILLEFEKKYKNKRNKKGKYIVKYNYIDKRMTDYELDMAFTKKK